MIKTNEAGFKSSCRSECDVLELLNFGHTGDLPNGRSVIDIRARQNRDGPCASNAKQVTTFVLRSAVFPFSPHFDFRFHLLPRLQNSSNRSQNSPLYLVEPYSCHKPFLSSHQTPQASTRHPSAGPSKYVCADVNSSRAHSAPRPYQPSDCPMPQHAAIHALSKLFNSRNFKAYVHSLLNLASEDRQLSLQVLVTSNKRCHLK